MGPRQFSNPRSAWASDKSESCKADDPPALANPGVTPGTEVPGSAGPKTAGWASTLVEHQTPGETLKQVPKPFLTLGLHTGVGPISGAGGRERRKPPPLHRLSLYGPARRRARLRAREPGPLSPGAAPRPQPEQRGFQYPVGSRKLASLPRPRNCSPASPPLRPRPTSAGSPPHTKARSETVFSTSQSLPPVVIEFRRVWSLLFRLQCRIATPPVKCPTPTPISSGSGVRTRSYLGAVHLRSGADSLNGHEHVVWAVSGGFGRRHISGLAASTVKF